MATTLEIGTLRTASRRILLLGIIALLAGGIEAAPAVAQPMPTPTPVQTPTPMPTTYAGMALHCRVTTPFTIPAGATFHGICQSYGTLPDGLQYGVVVRAVVYAQAGATETTCLVELADGAVYGTPVTVPANATVNIPFEDTGPGSAGQMRTPALTIQAGTGGPLTILPGTTLTLEAIASQPGNNAY
jgi:hypothetical protein